MKTVAVIPARWGSTRFPGKSLVPLCGHPLILWCVAAVERAGSIDEILVATDDERIAAAVAGSAARAVMTSSAHPSGTDRVAEAVEDLEADVVINVQGDEPLIDHKLLDRLVDAMSSDKSWDMATAAAPLTRVQDVDNKNVVKVVRAASGMALYFSRAPIPFERDRGRDAADLSLYWRHLGVYAYRHDFLKRFVSYPPSRLEQAEKLEQLRALDMGGRILVLDTADEGIGVDTPEDVAYAEELLRKAGAVL